MKFKPLLFFAGGVLWMSIPIIAAAQGLVPCNGLNCDLCQLGQLVQNIINFLVGISIPLSVGLFGWAGVLMFSAVNSPERRERGKKVFQSVFIGFAIIISAWLIVQTVLSVLVNDEFFIGGNWSDLKCASPEERESRMNADISEFIESALGTAPSGVSSTNCPVGSTYNPERRSCINTQTNQPVQATTYPVQNTARGNCSTAAMTPIWGTNAAAMGCIAQNESACGALPRSTVDVTTTGRPISIGLYQINLSAHQMTCNNVTLDCPKAFSGTYTGSNRNVTIKDQALYDQCVAAALNVGCNTEKAKQIFATEGIRAWGARTACGL